MAKLLEVKNLTTQFFTSAGTVQAVDDVSFDVDEGETVAVVGVADSISEAETLAEKEVSSIKGPLFHRTDIGTDEIIQKRIDHMNSLRC